MSRQPPDNSNPSTQGNINIPLTEGDHNLFSRQTAPIIGGLNTTFFGNDSSSSQQQQQANPAGHDANGLPFARQTGPILGGKRATDKSTSDGKDSQVKND